MLIVSPWKYDNGTAPERVWKDIEHGAENVRKNKYGPEQVTKNISYRPNNARKILDMDKKMLGNVKSNMT